MVQREGSWDAYNLIPYQRRALNAGQCGVEVTGLPPKGGSLPLKLDEPSMGEPSLSIIVTPSGIEPSEVNSLPLPAKAGSPTEVSL